MNIQQSTIKGRVPGSTAMHTVRVNDLALFSVIEGDCPTIVCCVGILTQKNNFTCCPLVVALAQLKKESQLER